MIRVILIIVLLVVLSSCGTVGLLPNTQLVEKAIAIQLQETQAQLNRQLDTDFLGFEIKDLRIKREEPLTIQNLPAFRVLGTYNLTVKLPTQQFKKSQQPFEIYLQIQQQGKSWRLLLPEKQSQDTPSTWHSYLII